MSEVLIAQPKWGEGQLFRALEREFRSGLELKKAQEELRERAAAANAAELRGNSRTTKIGKHVAEIPSWEFFRMQQKYGHDEVHSRGFIRYLQKKFPHLATSKV